MRRYKGQTVTMTKAAVESYGEQYRGQRFTISHIATKYMPAAKFYAQDSPEGYHPGYNSATGSALYDFKELDFSLYEWEVRR